MKSQRHSAFTIVELLIIVAVVGLLAALAIPNLVHARGWTQQNACINNLRYIDGAKQEWAIDNKISPDGNPDLPEIRIYLGRGMGGFLPYCPLDHTTSFSNSYGVNGLTNAPNCKVSTGNHILF